ncbi:hypothetical protein QBC46DRAFT_389865 [Diplogelasinospora grovesii]|uniref:Uncharacterized protein n=1 Tax=Diplogelasinospora grovesii TaxID=303347 RepID=A0AAN6N3I7_9PEZI|nr:hypothetical protein QBC46DRAFT_389865 [Diplogelasinospora grovesii]
MAAPVVTQQKAPAETHPPYPTYEALRAARQWVRPAPTSGQLLFWPLDGPLDTAISVMSSPSNPDAREPYYNQSTGTWHPVAKLPITEPKVSSITVHVSELQDWEETWCDAHWDHSDPDAPDAFEGVEWGTLRNVNEDDERDDDGAEDGDDEGEGEGKPQLLRCCGMARPRGKDASVVVKPARTDGEEDGGFVTVHDYLTVVHPWLMGLRGDILGAMGTMDGQDEPLGEDTDLMVNCNALDGLRMDTRDVWIRRRKGDPMCVLTWSVRELNGSSK